MKKRSLSASLRPNGILRWSTACVLAGTLASCDRGYTVTEQDAVMAKLQTGIDTLDSQESILKSGLVPNNFQIPGLGYYHSGKHSFLEHPYNFRRDGKWFVDGEWSDLQGPESIAPSRPSPEELKRVDEFLSAQQKAAEKSGTASTNHSGFGFGNMLMMYWLLSGNRGFFSPGAGFQNAQRNAGDWNTQVNRNREQVARHSAANPGYTRMVQQSRMQGTPVTPGQTVRGGFGSSRSGGGFSSGG